MRQFIGRTEELKALEEEYRTPGFRMTILYGRRRIGKSTLLQKFIEGRKSVFYTAIRSGIAKNIELLGMRVLEVLAPEAAGLHFDSIDQIFSFLTKYAQKERIVFVIDEFPYLAEQDSSLLSVIQKYIDTQWLNTRLYLILSGSSVSFMEDKVLNGKSPLYGRRTSQIKLKAFSYLDSADFVPTYSEADKALVYGVTGGIAKYLSLFDETKSVHENICALYFRKSGYMYEETSNLLTQEFRNVSTYSAILNAVAAGKNKMTEIADAAHLERSVTAHAIANLISTGIMEKRFAITDEQNKKKVQYVLADHMFRFWYRFVPDAIDLIELGRGEQYYHYLVKKRLPEYMGDVFEDMCRYYTLLKGIEGKLGCLVTSVGKWWGTNPDRHEETDIDVVGLDKIEHTAVLGECKYKNELLDKSVLEDLKSRNGLISRKYRVVQYLLFSKSGFTQWIKDHAKEQAILPVTLEQMYQL